MGSLSRAARLLRIASIASAKSQACTWCPRFARGTASVPVAQPMSSTVSDGSSARSFMSQCS